jgi:hypothetical protein
MALWYGCKLSGMAAAASPAGALLSNELHLHLCTNAHGSIALMRRYALQDSLEAASSAGAGHAAMVIVSIGDQKGSLGKIAATAADELAGSTQLGDMAYATLV